jgi:PelA/Pel-15E family pectate lyase
MMRTTGFLICLLSLIALKAACAAGLTWKECLRQKPEFYTTAEAVRIADNVLLYQRDTGGWPKNIEMAESLDEQGKAELAAQKSKTDSTIDNSSTYTQMKYLARMFQAEKQERFKTAFLKGMDYLLAAQYENGGWPQYYPLRKDYSTHITFNDDAMIGAMSLLRDIAQKEPVYVFVDEERRAKAEKAVQKGVACILKCQVRVQGKRTVWCAQHDEKTLEPASARAYEKISLSGGESVNIVRFLMEIKAPSPDIVAAIEGAVGWFEKVQLKGIKVVEKPAPGTPKGKDKEVVADPQATPLWARFYEIGSDRPFFCGRDGIIKYSLTEIEYERRNGYAWYTDRPAGLLKKDYPAWKKRQSK